MLHQLFQRALSVGKRARTETAIARHVVSLPQAGARVASDLAGGLEGKRVVVVGAGRMSELAARAALDNGATDIVVANRSVDKAERLGTELGGSGVGLDELPELLGGADVLITATSSTGHVLERDDLVRALDGRPLVIVDLALPRDIDPDARDLDGVVLRDIEDLRSVVDEGAELRKAELPKVHAIVDGAVEEFSAWERSLALGPAIESLKTWAEEIRAAEVVKLAKGGETEELDRVTQRAGEQAAAPSDGADARARPAARTVRSTSRRSRRSSISTRPSSSVLRIGTRGSALALRQADLAVEHLVRVRPGLVVDIVVISTKGDRDKSSPFAELGTKSIFAHELQRALLDDEIDVAVHSLKDLTGAEPDGLVIASVPERADPRDVLVSRDGASLGELSAGAVVGTSSVRREALVRMARPDLRTAPLRGNVDTRLRKVADGEVDAAILAAAGIVRLQRSDEITQWLDAAEFVPPPGQGAIAIEARADRVAGDLAWVASSEDPIVRRCVDTERVFMQIVEGSCEVPLGAWARPSDDDDAVIVVDAFLVPPSGEIARAHAHGNDPGLVGAEVARLLI